MTQVSERGLQRLARMLEYKRPHGSASERKFINRFIYSLPGFKVTDLAGNIWLRVGEPGGSRTLFCAHTDSVHRDAGKQRIAITDKDIIRLGSGERANCLGADNAAGVWLLTELIYAGVPGLYVFFREEESGGIGSKHFADTQTALTAQVDRAIAFDRRGTTSVITHQWAGRTCSDAFATALCDALAMGHKPDDGGTFTDTASLASDIPECTNISVGFRNEHSMSESLDLGYLVSLRDRVVSLDWESLPVARDPGDYDAGDPYHGDDFFDFPPLRAGLGKPDRSNDADGWTPPTRHRSLVDLVRSYPHAVAEWLTEMGVDPDTFADEIDALSGWTLGCARA